MWLAQGQVEIVIPVTTYWMLSLHQFKLKKDGNTFRSVNYILLMGTGCYGVCKMGI
jgi:ABC-type nickel/cobalt efflux system permease component RcnA